jgi:hypothetical protein
MPFLISATDTCGRVTLRRETAVAALKKAAEFAEDGYRDIEITGPDGRHHAPQTFDELPANGWAVQSVLRGLGGLSGKSATRCVFEGGRGAGSKLNFADCEDCAPIGQRKMVSPSVNDEQPLNEVSLQLGSWRLWTVAAFLTGKWRCAVHIEEVEKLVVLAVLIAIVVFVATYALSAWREHRRWTQHAAVPASTAARGGTVEAIPTRNALARPRIANVGHLAALIRVACAASSQRLQHDTAESRSRSKASVHAPTASTLLRFIRWRDMPVREAKRWTRFLFRALVQGEEMKVNRSSASIILVLTKSKYWPSKPVSPK